MSIYPERNRSKRFTGLWIVEVSLNGKKVKERCSTYEQAQAAEDRLKGLEPDTPTSPREPELTLDALDQMAGAKVWRGQKDELQTTQRWAVCVKLIGRATPLASIRKPQLEALAEALRATGKGPKTINRYMSCVSRMLRYAHEADLIPGTPAIPWQREGAGRKAFLPEAMTEPFLTYIEENIGTAYSFAAEVLILTGMRISELTSLHSSEVVDDVVYLSHTKTDKPRSIPLPEGYGQLLVDWIKSGGVAYRVLLSAVGEASEHLQIRPKITLHALRHTTATRLTAKGVPSLTVAKLMGHSSLATTNGYTHHEVETLRAATAKLVTSAVGASAARLEVKHKQIQRANALLGICSPLRSHSATRPKPK